MNPLPMLRKMTEQDRIAELKKLSDALDKPAAAMPDTAKSQARTKAARPTQ